MTKMTLAKKVRKIKKKAFVATTQFSLMSEAKPPAVRISMYSDDKFLRAWSAVSLEELEKIIANMRNELTGKVPSVEELIKKATGEEGCKEAFKKVDEVIKELEQERKIDPIKLITPMTI